jgi:hypothetical protein
MHSQEPNINTVDSRFTPPGVDVPRGSVDIAYTSPYIREEQEQDQRIMVLTPWTVQNICYEILKNYMLANPPQNEGYRFSQKYEEDDITSGIALEIAYHYKDTVVQKRPGIYVSRGDTAFTFPTINQLIGSNSAESEKMRYVMLQMPINIAVVATNIGFVEQLAEYVFKVFLRYQEIIKKDFCIRQFKLAALGQPSLYLESKDHFVVNISLQSVFDMGAVIKGDDLKLKTVSYAVFTSCAEQPLLNQ